MQKVEESNDGVSMSGYPGCEHPSKLMTVSQGGHGEAEVLSNPDTPDCSIISFDHPLFLTLPEEWRNALTHKTACNHIACNHIADIIELNKLDKLQFFNTKFFFTGEFEKAVAYFCEIFLSPVDHHRPHRPLFTSQLTDPFKHYSFMSLPIEWGYALKRYAPEYVYAIVYLHKRNKLKFISADYCKSGKIREAIDYLFSIL